jgi:hypothetical protein
MTGIEGYTESLYTPIWYWVGYISLVGGILYLAIKCSQNDRRQGSMTTWKQLFRGDPWQK